MEDNQPKKGRGKVAGAAGLLVAGAVAGGVLAATLSASADSTTAAASATAAPSASPRADRDGDHRSGPVGGATPVRSDEKQVTGTDADTIRAAALKAVPGGTVYRVETDAGDGTYEAHMTKADGTRVTVKFGKDLAVTGVENGMGKGDPAPAGHDDHAATDSSR